MTDTINPGEGWRLLADDEVVREGDEFLRPFETRWVRTSSGDHCIGKTVNGYSGNAFRRRIEQTAALQLPPGYWRMRSGDKAEVVGVSVSGLVLGVLPSGSVTEWDGSGSYYHDVETPSGNDLLEPWTDEPTDKEIADAVRWFHAKDKLLVHIGSGRYEVESPQESGRTPSPSDFVNAYRKANA